MKRVVFFIFFISINTYALECKITAFPIKNKNYSNQEAFIYFEKIPRKHLYEYFLDSVLVGKSVLKGQLYKYLYRTETKKVNRIILDSLYKLGHKVQKKDEICSFIKKVQSDL